jgi:hypothetical protein
VQLKQVYFNLCLYLLGYFPFSPYVTLDILPNRFLV